MKEKERKREKGEGVWWVKGNPKGTFVPCALQNLVYGGQLTSVLISTEYVTSKSVSG